VDDQSLNIAVQVWKKILEKSLSMKNAEWKTTLLRLKRNRISLLVVL
jgi:hypothetical protein